MKWATPVLLAGEPREFVWGDGAERPVGVIDEDGGFAFEASRYEGREGSGDAEDEFTFVAGGEESSEGERRELISIVSRRI